MTAIFKWTIAIVLVTAIALPLFTLLALGYLAGAAVLCAMQAWSDFLSS